MLKKILPIFSLPFLVATLLVFSSPVLAASDVSISDKDVYLGKRNMKVGEKTRIYATVRNQGDTDISGTIRFIEENSAQNISEDLQFSTLAGRSDDIFFDMIPEREGEYRIRVEIFPEDAVDENRANNETVQIFFAGQDFDDDGIIDAQDKDMDGDGVHNQYDAFPKNPREYLDSDYDGTGNNHDSDDDNDGIPDSIELENGTNPLESDTDQDGVSDKEDLYPLDASESGDFDADGVGDREDQDDDNDGTPDSEDVSSKNPGPEIFVRFPEDITINEKAIFDASESKDRNGEIVRVQWFFGDEVLEGKKVYKVFTSPGLHKVNVKISDNGGESRTQALFVSVHASWPTWKKIVLGILMFFFLFGLASQLWRFTEDKRS
jgi:hypothetical protein